MHAIERLQRKHRQSVERLFVVVDRAAGRKQLRRRQLARDIDGEQIPQPHRLLVLRQRPCESSEESRFAAVLSPAIATRRDEKQHGVEMRQPDRHEALEDAIELLTERDGPAAHPGGDLAALVPGPEGLLRRTEIRQGRKVTHGRSPSELPPSAGPRTARRRPETPPR